MFLHRLIPHNAYSYWGFIVGVLIFIPVNVSGFDNLIFHDTSETPWQLLADELEYDHKSEQYIATGNVTITKNNKKLSADVIRFDHRAMRAVAEGNVMMLVGEDILTGNRIEIDFTNETGTIFDGTIFIKENHFYIKGDKIQKTGENEYAVYKGSISTCDGENPAWKITGENVTFALEGYGVVRHAAFWAKDLPVMYAPILIFPVKEKRQTGLLIPRFGYSKKNGAEINQPFYWAINESSDATFYEHYMENRGHKIGLEYRYALDERSKGTFIYDYLYDRKPYENKDQQFSRYWFRMKLDQKMPYDFFAKIDIDIVRDSDYLSDFKSGYTGFDKTEGYFYENFGRQMDDYGDSTRRNSIFMSKIRSDYTLNFGARWYDTPQADNTDDTLHQLPFFQFNSLKKPVWKSDFYWKLDSEYAHFYRKEGTKGHRIDINPRMSLPKRFRNYFTVEPSIGLRETVWYVDEDFSTLSEYGPETREENDDTLHRESYDIKLDFFSNLFKVYQQKKNGDRIRHTLRPQITYEYIPKQEQDEYPLFDFSDQIEKKNRIIYSITNRFISRSSFLSLDSDTEKEPHTYHQFCRFKLEQSYDISSEYRIENSEFGTQNSEYEIEAREKRFSPVYGEIELIPGDFLSIQADSQWSLDENEFKSHNVSMNLSDERGNRFFAEHRYTQNSSESIFTEIALKLSDRWTLYSDYERNLHDNEDIRTCAGLLYTTQCWSADFTYTDENNDQKYAFMINLKGLGGIGTNK